VARRDSAAPIPPEEDPVLRKLREAPLDDELDFICPVDGTELVARPDEETSCPKCGTQCVENHSVTAEARADVAAGRVYTSDELRRELGLPDVE